MVIFLSLHDYMTCAAIVLKMGSEPTCLKQCQCGVMEYGTIGELVKFVEVKRKTVLLAPCAGLV